MAAKVATATLSTGTKITGPGTVVQKMVSRVPVVPEAPKAPTKTDK